MGGSLSSIGPGASEETFPWYALRVRSRHERLIASVLDEKGYETFLPLYRSRRRWSDRIKELELPLFPGYLFCRFDVMRRLPILVTPGVLGVVSSGRLLAPIDEQEIGSIRALVTSDLQAEPWPFLHVGQRVRIEQGPLTGVEGILSGVKKPYRLILSVTLLQRSVAVEVDRSSVSPVEDCGATPGGRCDASLRSAVSASV